MAIALQQGSDLTAHDNHSPWAMTAVLRAGVHASVGQEAVCSRSRRSCSDCLRPRWSTEDVPAGACTAEQLLSTADAAMFARKRDRTVALHRP
jgi:hypothetical protein